MNSQELILSACSAKGSVASGSKTASTAAIHLHDLATTAPVQAFKTSNSAAECLATVASRDGQGGTIWAVQEGKAIAGVWAWQKVRPVSRGITDNLGPTTSEDPSA